MTKHIYSCRPLPHHFCAGSCLPLPQNRCRCLHSQAIGRPCLLSAVHQQLAAQRSSSVMSSPPDSASSGAEDDSRGLFFLVIAGNVSCHAFRTARSGGLQSGRFAVVSFRRSSCRFQHAVNSKSETLGIGGRLTTT
jgi:hypothetical protein